jgi:hypothetical protein
MEGQTIQWPKDTKGVIRSRKLKDRQYNDQKIPKEGHCIVCPSSIYGFWLLLWYLLVIVLFVLLPFTASDYSFGILWSLYCLLLYWVHLSWAGFECTLWSINIHCLLNTINMSLRKAEDNKGVIRSRKLKDRQYNDQKKKKKRTNI